MRLATDLRHALRTARRHPGSTAAIVLSLALGVGPNVVMFSAVDAVLLRPLPFRDPDRLVVVHGAGSRGAVEFFGRARAVESVASYSTGFAELGGGKAPEVIHLAEVSASFFPLLGVQPRLGRLFIADDQRPAAPRVALISSAFWWRSFGADASVLERPITVAGQPCAVVGILPPGFEFPDGVEVWVVANPGRRFAFSTVSDADQKTRMGRGGLLARLREGATLESARREIVALHRQRQEDARRTRPELGVTSVGVRDLHETMVGQARSSLILLLGGAGFVLLIALANAAHLMLERSEARRRELAIRVALGAGRGRIVRQLVVEGLFYGLLATALGFALAHLGLAVLRAGLDPLIPAGVALHMDHRALVFAVAASVATGLLAGLVPARHFIRSFANGTLRAEPLRQPVVADGHSRALLVISEVAVAVTLLAGAGLLLKSLALKTDETRAALGFRSEGVLTFEVALPQGLYSASQAVQVRERILDQLRSLPGVESAAATDSVPYGSQSSYWLDVEGKSREDPTAYGDMADVYVVTPEYLATMGIPILAGRALSDTDREASVVLASEDLARQFWPNQAIQHVLGQRIKLPDEDVSRTIVGIVGTVRTAEDGDPPFPQLYVPAGPSGGSATIFVVHTRGDPSAMATSARASVAAIDPMLPVWRIATMDARVARTFAPRRSRTALLSLFAGLAVLLSGLGTYAVMAYAVALRTREIGIRQAFGAGPRDVIGLVLGQGMRQACLGVGIGLALAAGLSRLLAGFLYQVRGFDIQVYAAAAACMAGVALGACLPPLRRALLIDPANALRHE